MDIEGSDGKIPADIYRPNNKGKNPAVIFLIGTRELRSSATVQKYAKVFVKAGFVVLIPEISDLVEVKMRDTTIDKIVSVFDYLSGSDFVDSNKVGFSGICAGASLSLLAASDVRINNKVKFVNVISPYYDVWDLSRELFTGKVHDNSKVEAWQPLNDSKQQLQLWYIGQIKDGREQKLIEDTLIDNKYVSQNDLGNFSEEAKNIFNFIKSDNDVDFDRNLALLSQEVKVQVEAMSVRGKVSNLKARVYILADSLDPTVSPVQSKRLAESLPKDQVKFSYISVLDHVVPTRSLKRFGLVQDAVKIYLHIHSFLTYLEEKEG